MLRHCRCEEALLELEKKHRITRRWQRTDPEYTEMRDSLAHEKQKQLLLAIWSAVVKRHMLLGLKARYAGMCLSSSMLCSCEYIHTIIFSDGQKIARHLSAQITKESHRVKQLFEQYNAMCAGDGVGSCRVSLASVLDPQDVFWHAHADLPGQSNSPIPLALRQELIRFHLQMKRS